MKGGVEWPAVQARLPEALRVELRDELHRGIVSNKWLVTAAGKPAVLRADRPVARAIGLDRDAECDVLQLLADAGYPTAPLYCRPDSGLLVTPYVAGEVWYTDEFRDPDRLRLIARVLRDLHDRRLIGPPYELGSRLSHYADLVDTDAARSAYREAGGLLQRLTADESTFVLCHNDPVAGNAVMGRTLELIDWEFAAVGDPLFDLAAVIEYHALSSDATEAFLAAYAGEGSRWRGDSRLADWCRVYQITLTLWDALLGMLQRNIIPF